MAPSTSQQDFFFFFKEGPRIAVFTSSLLYKFHYRLKLYILAAQMGWSVITTAGPLLEHTAYFNCVVLWSRQFRRTEVKINKLHLCIKTVLLDLIPLKNLVEDQLAIAFITF